MFLQPPNSQQLEKIREFTNENIQTREESLRIIKEWMRKEPHLPDVWDDVVLLNFLRSCKFSIEKTKFKIDKYLAFKTSVPEAFDGRDVHSQEIRHLLSVVEFGTLPQLTSSGERVHFILPLFEQYTSSDILSYIQMVTMWGELLLKLQEDGWSGDIYVMDCRSCTMKNFILVDPLLMKKTLLNFQHGWPSKIKSIHFVNVNPFVDFLIKWIAPMTKEKLIKRIRIHKNYESLLNVLPKEFLTEEFGGSGGKTKELQNMLVKAIEDNFEWLKQQEEIKVDESRRVELKNSENWFGAIGSFKKLEID